MNLDNREAGNTNPLPGLINICSFAVRVGDKRKTERLYIVDTCFTGWHSSAIDERGIKKMRVTVKKWGNSAAVRLPASVMQATQLQLDEVVEVREDKGRIVIERVTPRKYELSELLKGITSKNQHQAIDFGPAVGGEIW